MWDELFAEATAAAAEFDLVPSTPRLAGRQKHRPNVPADDPKQYWQRALYYPLLDHLIRELEDRLLSPEERFLAQYLIPHKQEGLTDEIRNRLYEAYKDDLPAADQGVFNGEITRWKTRWAQTTDKPRSLATTLAVTNCELYANVSVCLTILLTMPVSTASAERSFSTMRRVKTYLRATMLTERLSSLALLHAHKHMPINIDSVIQRFSERKNRRLAFVFGGIDE